MKFEFFFHACLCSNSKFVPMFQAIQMRISLVLSQDSKLCSFCTPPTLSLESLLCSLFFFFFFFFFMFCVTFVLFSCLLISIYLLIIIVFSCPALQSKLLTFLCRCRCAIAIIYASSCRYSALSAFLSELATEFIFIQVVVLFIFLFRSWNSWVWTKVTALIFPPMAVQH